MMQFMGGEIGGMNGLSPPLEIASRGDGDPASGADAPRDQPSDRQSRRPVPPGRCPPRRGSTKLSLITQLDLNFRVQFEETRHGAGRLCSRPKATGMLSRKPARRLRVRPLPDGVSRASANRLQHVARQLVKLLAVIGLKLTAPGRGGDKQPRPEDGLRAPRRGRLTVGLSGAGLTPRRRLKPSCLRPTRTNYLHGRRRCP